MDKEDILQALREVNKIYFPDVIVWCNKNDIDYVNMTDIEMLMEYIKVNGIS